MRRCRVALALAALLCAPPARGADEPKPVTITGEGFTGLSFSPDGKTLAVVTRFAGVELREPTTGTKRATLKGFWPQGDVVFSSDGGMLAAGYAGVERRGDAAKLGSFRERTFASLGFKEAVRIWDTRTGEPKAQLQDVETMTHVAFAPAGKKVAAANDHTVRIWDLVTEKLLADRHRDTETVTVLAFTSDGTKLAVGTLKGPIYILDATPGGNVLKLDEHMKPVRALAFAPDGKFLHSAGSNGAVRRWDLSTGRAELTAIKHYAEFTRMAFSSDRRWVVGGDERGGVTVWDAVTAEQRLDFEGHGDKTSCLAISADGKLLASGTSRFLSSTGDFTSTLTIQTITLPAKK